MPLRRTHFTGESQPVEVTLDEACSLGTFLEIEIMANDDEWQLARDQIVRLAEHWQILDLREPRSYLRMLLEQHGVTLPLNPSLIRSP